MFDSIKSALLPPGLALLGAFFIYSGFVEGQNAKALADHGKTAHAIVDQVQWKEKRLSGSEKNFKLDVHFETEDKQTIATKLSVPKDMGQRFRDSADNTIDVKYLPEHPSTVVLANASDDSMVMLGGGALAILAGVGLFLYRRKKA